MEIFYCFLEAKVKLFSDVDEHRLSYAINFLGINMLACTEAEVFFLGRTLPSQFAPFKLLREQNLLCLRRLLLLKKVRSRAKRLLVMLTLSFHLRPISEPNFLCRACH